MKNGLIKNTKDVEFKVGEDQKSFTVTELSVKDLEEYMRKAHNGARKTWLKRIHEVADGLDIKEKSRFLVEASKIEPDLSDDINKWLFTDEGFKAALFKACPDIKEDWDRVLEEADNAKPLIEAWQTAVGVLEDIKKSEDDIGAVDDVEPLESSTEKNVQ